MQLQHLRQHLNTWKQDSVCQFGGVRANRARDSGLFRMVLRPNYNPIRESEGKSKRDVEVRLWMHISASCDCICAPYLNSSIYDKCAQFTGAACYAFLFCSGWALIPGFHPFAGSVWMQKMTKTSCGLPELVSRL